MQTGNFQKQESERIFILMPGRLTQWVWFLWDIVTKQTSKSIHLLIVESNKTVYGVINWFNVPLCAQTTTIWANYAFLKERELSKYESLDEYFIAEDKKEMAIS